MAAIGLRSNRTLLHRMASSAAWRTFQGRESTLIRHRDFCQDASAVKTVTTKKTAPKSLLPTKKTPYKFLFPNGPNSMGFAPGIYKAMLIGKVGQTPLVKTIPNGSEVVTFALGTGGVRNNRKALPDETTEAYEQRSFTQWHKVCVYKTSLLSLARQITKGMNVYIEGSIETRIFKDRVSGTLKRVREISVRQNGRVYIMGVKPLSAADMEN